jgi:hypothetical protein
MTEPAYRKGQQIVCTNGHVIGEVLEDVHAGDMAWGDKFGNWTQDTIPKAGSYAKPVCAICGADFFKPNSWDFYTKGQP